MWGNEGLFPNYIIVSAVFYFVELIAKFIYQVLNITSNCLVLLYYISYKIFIGMDIILFVIGLSIFIAEYFVIKDYNSAEHAFSTSWVMYSLIKCLPSLISFIIFNISVFESAIII